MKNTILLLISLITATAVSGQQKYKIVAFGFYNLENFYDTINQPNVDDDEFTPNGFYHYDGRIFMDKVDHLAEVISLIGTDETPDGLAFFGCAEIENRTVLETLANHPKLKSRNYQIVHYDGPDLRGVDCGFLYNPKYFKVLYSCSNLVNLKMLDKNNIPTRDVLYIKGVLNGTDTIHVFVNHWPSRRGSSEATAPKREFAARVSKKIIDSLMAINPNTKVIDMGDLNDNPTDVSMTKVLGCVDKKENCKPGGLFNPWVDFYKKGAGTLAFNDAWGIFDQEVISSGWLSHSQSGYFYQGAHIFQRDFMITKTGKYKGYPKRTWDFNIYNAGYSDHLPTYITVLKAVDANN
ncbi:MAG: endonuclease/exonuclease/phosphatase [Bacteroidota bacterium]|nr:endonuclease/exonuclease/phosphatase [Bacteroidota bacterium]